MANWWDQYQLAPQNDVTSTGFAQAPMPAPPAAQAAQAPPQAAPQAPPGMAPGSAGAQIYGQRQPQGAFAGLPPEVLMMSGMVGPQQGMRFLSPFMTQAPIEVMGPDGRPQLVSPWEARGLTTPKTTIDFRADDRSERQFGLEQRKFQLESAKSPVSIDTNGRITVNPAALEAARQNADVTQPPIPVQVPGQPGQQVLVPRSVAAGQSPPREQSQGDKDSILAADAAAQAAAQAKISLARALDLNKTAFQGPTAGASVAAGRAWSTLGGNAPQTVATTELNTIMKETALAQLKGIFGANPTEGERKILLEVQGSGDMSRGEREALIHRAQVAVDGRLRVNTETGRALRDTTYYQPGGGPSMPQPPPAAPTVTVPMPGAASPPSQGGGPWQKYGKR